MPINGTTGWHSVDQTLSYWTNFNSCVQVDTNILPDLDPTDGCTVEKISYTNCTNNSNVIYYKVVNGGHTWPGAGPPGYPAGNTNQDINANVEIWNFFKDYQISQTSIENNEKDGIPSDYVLFNNYPNPFNPTTTIVYGLRERTNIELIVFDVLGRKIETIIDGEQAAGYYEMEFNASRLASGIYFYRLQAGEFIQTKKMLILK